jgi:hypothetical protein
MKQIIILMVFMLIQFKGIAISIRKANNPKVICTTNTTFKSDDPKLVTKDEIDYFALGCLGFFIISIMFSIKLFLFPTNPSKSFFPFEFFGAALFLFLSIISGFISSVRFYFHKLMRGRAIVLSIAGTILLVAAIAYIIFDFSN